MINASSKNNINCYLNLQDKYSLNDFTWNTPGISLQSWCCVPRHLSIHIHTEIVSLFVCISVLNWVKRLTSACMTFANKRNGFWSHIFQFVQSSVQLTELCMIYELYHYENFQVNFFEHHTHITTFRIYWAHFHVILKFLQLASTIKAEHMFRIWNRKRTWLSCKFQRSSSHKLPELLS